VNSKYRLPKTLLKDLVKFVTQRLNMFSSKRGYPNVPAIEALTGEKINLSKDVRFCFGDYALCVIPNLGVKKNDVLQPRTEPAIALCNADSQGGVVFASLISHRRMVRHKFNIIPLTQQIIDQVNNWSTEVVGELEEDPDYDGQDDLDELIVAQEPQPAQLEDEYNVPRDTESSSSVASDVNSPVLGLPQLSDTTLEEESLNLSANESAGTIGGDEARLMPVETGRSDELDSRRHRASTSYGMRANSKPNARYALSTHGRTVTLASTGEAAPQEHIRSSVAHAWQISTGKQFPEETSRATRDELQQMIDRQVFTPVKYCDLPYDRRSKLIRSFIFSRVKYDSRGVPTK
jgi:hypothetical protein